MLAGMPLELKPVTEKNLGQVCRLEVGPGQERLVSPNAFSVAQSKFHPAWECWAFYEDDRPVGFGMVGEDDEVQDDGHWWIIRLMIGADHQGRGLGRALTQALVSHLRAKEGCRAISLSVVPENQRAAALYRSLGFVETGEVEEGEVVHTLPPEALAGPTS